MMIPIIDTHQHLWDLDQFRLPWLDDGGPLAKSHISDHYLTDSEGLHIAKTVYMEVDVEPGQRPAEAEYVIDLCARVDNLMAAAVIGGDPSDPGFNRYIEQFKGSPHIKGVRQVLHGSKPPGYCLRPEFISGIRKLGEMGLSFDLCMRPTELRDAGTLAQTCPETRFILDHCGNADVKETDLSDWKHDMEFVARRPNVVCKVSGIVASALPNWSSADLAPIIQHTAEVFGADRIMFGSDWPVCTLTSTLHQWAEALKEIVSGWQESDQRKLFHDTAARFYGI